MCPKVEKVGKAGKVPKVTECKNSHSKRTFPTDFSERSEDMLQHLVFLPPMILASSGLSILPSNGNLPAYARLVTEQVVRL